jgi:hypothetical protein
MKHCAFIHPPYGSQSRSAQLSGPRPVYFTIILKEFEICIAGEQEVVSTTGGLQRLPSTPLNAVHLPATAGSHPYLFQGAVMDVAGHERAGNMKVMIVAQLLSPRLF